LRSGADINDLEGANCICGAGDETQKESNKLRMEKDKLEGVARPLDSFLQKRAEKLGISPDELEHRGRNKGVFASSHFFD